MKLQPNAVDFTVVVIFCRCFLLYGLSEMLKGYVETLLFKPSAEPGGHRRELPLAVAHTHTVWFRNRHCFISHAKNKNKTTKMTTKRQQK